MLRRVAKLLGIRWRSESEDALPAQPPANSSASLAEALPSDETGCLDFQPLSSGRGKQTRAARLHRVSLNQLGLFGPAWRERLASLGLHTAAQFINVSSEQWQQWGMTDAEIRKLRRWEKAVRLASRMPSMKPYEAMMLFAIHRRRRSRLAGELPGRLHRDLLRFALSSHGQRLLRSRQIPDRQRVETWIEAARSASSGFAKASS